MQVKSWRSNTGRVYPIDKMSTEHLINTMLYIKGRLEIESDPKTADHYKQTIVSMIDALKTRNFMPKVSSSFWRS